MEPTLAEIRLFGGNFAPRGWALCQGQLLAINSNQSLFSLLGTMYGGDGRTSFALPDLRGRVPIAAGHGAGLSSYDQGVRGGVERNTLTAANLPSHTHTAGAVGGQMAYPVGTSGDTDSPSGAYPGFTDGVNAYKAGATGESMAAPIQTNLQVTAMNAGASQSFSNIQPSLGLNYIICMQGLFPSRS